MKYKIIPEIKSIRIKSGSINIEDFHLEKDLMEIVPATKDFLYEVGELRGDKPIFYTNKPYKQEAYSIDINENGIELGASGEKGIFYGLITIAELLKLNRGVLSCCDIYDEPSMSFRAASDDISRGQVSTLDNFKCIIRRMAQYKYNVYMPYIEDVFAFVCEPESGKYSDPVKPEEWKEICRYAEKYYISVRPIINMLGHWDKNSKLEHFSDVMLKIPDKGITSVLNPENPKVRSMLLKMLDEVIDVFGPGIIHTGGDEPCELTDAFGKEKAGKLYVEHYRWLSEELKKRNCTMMMYADMFAPPWGDYSVGLEKALELPKGTSFVFWDYAAREAYPYVEKLTEMGLDILVSPGTWSWNTLSPQVKACWNNTKGLLKAADGKSRGIVMSSWNDGGDGLRELNFQGLAIGSIFAWNNDAKGTFEEFMDSFHKLFYGIYDSDLSKINCIYQCDELMDTDDYVEFKKQFWNDARKPVPEALKLKMIKLIKKLEETKQYIELLKPKFNIESFEALKFALDRQIFTAKKLSILKSNAYENREEAISYVQHIEELACYTAKLRETHKILWHSCNRPSEWGLVEAMYMDLEESFKSLARYCIYSKKMTENKFLL